jgi:hypothetical protein
MTNNTVKMKLMIIHFSTIVFLLFVPLISYAQSEEYNFVKDYIKGLGFRYELEKEADTEISKAGDDIIKMNLVSMRMSQKGKLKIREAINYLQPYKKSSREYLRSANDGIIESYESIIENYNASLDALEDITNVDLNTDMGKLSRRVTEITTRQDYISETLFKMTSFVAMLLIDKHPDENNKCSYLLVTSKERKELLKELELYFPNSVLKSKKNNPKYTVASAIILNTILAGEHKSSDQRKTR